MEEKDDILLRVRDLTVSFDGRRVVEGVNYDLRRGETLGIVGESGSGKSVSSLALMGLLPEKAKVKGSACLGDTELLCLDEKAMQGMRGQRIAMIFQDPMTSLNPMQRCGRQVGEMLKVHQKVENNKLKERVLELFREVMLPRPEKIFSSYPHELSGGQKQRVMIAMALICKPDVIIADEPATALDVTVQHTILTLLKDLQQRYGTSIIFITHDLGVISQVADEILVMYRGKVVERGTADEVLLRPKEAYTRGLLACRPPLEGHPHRLPTVEGYLNGITAVADENHSAKVAGTSIPNKLMQVSNLGVSYTLKKSLLGKPLQTLQAVDGVSFDLIEGETLGLVGESGCGKSTLGQALLSLIDHSAGTVAYRGRDLSTLSRSELRHLRTKIQIIFQDPYSSLNPRLTIGEAIAEPLKVHHRKDLTKEEIERRVEELMQQVGLQAEWKQRYPHQLSGGQRQRVCIARALIVDPELVVCDESVSALDVSVQAQVLNLLNDLKERYRFTYLFITHDLSVVHYMADRIMVMQRGQVVESGSPDQIFLHPKTDYTKSLIEAIPRIKK